MKFNAAIFLLLGATKVNSKFVLFPYGTMNDAVIATAATAVTAGSDVARNDVGRSHEYPRRVFRKNAKKTAHVHEIKDRPVCSIDRFPRVSKYQNCQGVEYNVVILCEDTNAHRTCKYTEHYVNSNGEKCIVEGSFDPIAQIGSTNSAKTGSLSPRVCPVDRFLHCRCRSTVRFWCASGCPHEYKSA